MDAGLKIVAMGCVDAAVCSVDVDNVNVMEPWGRTMTKPRRPPDILVEKSGTMALPAEEKILKSETLTLTLIEPLSN